MNQIQAGGQQVQLSSEVHVLLLTLGLNLALEFQFQSQMPGQLGGGGRLNNKKTAHEPSGISGLVWSIKRRALARVAGERRDPPSRCV